MKNTTRLFIFELYTNIERRKKAKKQCDDDGSDDDESLRPFLYFFPLLYSKFVRVGKNLFAVIFFRIKFFFLSITAT